MIFRTVLGLVTALALFQTPVAAEYPKSAKGTATSPAGSRTAAIPRFIARPLPMHPVFAMNRRGQIVGVRAADRAVIVWEQGKADRLIRLPRGHFPPNVLVLPGAISEEGVVTGTLESTGSGAITYAVSEPFTWQQGKMRILPQSVPLREVLSVGRWHTGRLPTEKSRVITYSRPEFPGETETRREPYYRAQVWRDAEPRRDIGTMGGDWSRVVGLNQQGQVVGSSATATGNEHAFLWQNGSLYDLTDALPQPSKGSGSRAIGIDDQGCIVVEVTGRGSFRLIPTERTRTID
ncbi:MAG: hypothetical protein H7Z41_10585 [Cytophagales bacterium]|nr:hypothetical protein [Armatimonadota bacterium]